MTTFNPNRLPALTKIMFEVQQKWSDKNCAETLKAHYREIEKLLQKTQIFAVWKKRLSHKYQKVTRELIPEIFLDAYTSIPFACMGLYKQANVCLRAQIETTLRLVYFSTHQVEFNWWHEGLEWYLDSKSKDVWGIEYKYFRMLKAVKDFEKESSLALFSNLKVFYKKLSKYVHGGAISFQTRPDRISPKYDIREFGRWATNFKDVQTYANTILVLGFPEVFRTSDVDTQRKILKVIENKKCKEGLRRSLGLRIRGRI